MTRDLVQPALASFGRPGSERSRFWMGKLMVIVLAVAGLAIAWRPPASFLRVATQAFTGLAVLFPTVIATLYSRRATAAGCLASILVGEGLVVTTYIGAFPEVGTLPVVPIVAVCSVVLVAVSAMTQRFAGQPDPIRGVPVTIRRSSILWMLPLGAVFFLANDFWAWGDSRPGWLGYPQWLWRACGLCLATAAVFAVASRREVRRHLPQGEQLTRDGSAD